MSHSGFVMKWESLGGGLSGQTAQAVEKHGFLDRQHILNESSLQNKKPAWARGFGLKTKFSTVKGL